MTKKLLWKSLPADMAPRGFQYRIGQWCLHKGKVEICQSGFHASENVIDAMGFVPAEMIAQVEVRGKSDIQEDKQAWSEMKIVKAWKWEKEDSVALSIFAAELCIGNYEKVYPDDKRPRKAIEAAKKWLLEPTKQNESAAESAESAAESAARSAELAAESAARSAELAAESAARSAELAARSALSAVWLAAESAARSAELAARSALSAVWLAELAARSALSAVWLAAKNDIKEKCANFVIERLEKKKPIVK